MFRTAPAAELAHDDVVASAEPVPITHLALDLGEPPAGGWTGYLAGRGLEVLTDDLGRPAVSRGDARLLLDERREAEARKREAAERQEQQAIEADRVRRASIWGGLPTTAIPEGVSAASAMFAADRDARPRRQSVLEEGLSNSGGYTFHSLGPSPEGES